MKHGAIACLAAGMLLAGGGLMPAHAQPRMGGSYYPEAPPGNAALGQRIAASHCAACHGTEGNGTEPQFPKLAGQNPAYLYRQLQAFRSGTRTSPAMAQAVAGLSDAQMAGLARFFGEQSIRPDPVTNPGLARLGERVFFERGGQGAPPCAACHSANGGGMRMRGMMGGGMGGPIPNLYGQHAAYTLDQLNRYASGARPDGVMNRIATTLSEAERRAVAAYLAGPP